jgi:hypothetical protein
MDLQTMYQFVDGLDDATKAQIIEALQCNQQGLITGATYTANPQFAGSFTLVAN